MGTINTLATDVALRVGDTNLAEITQAQYIQFVNMAMADLDGSGWLQRQAEDVSTLLANNTWDYNVPAGFAYIQHIFMSDVDGTYPVDAEIPQHMWYLGLDSTGLVPQIHFYPDIFVGVLISGRYLKIKGQARFSAPLVLGNPIPAGAESFIRERAVAYAADALSAGNDEQAQRRGRIADKAWATSNEKLKLHPQEFRVLPNSLNVPASSTNPTSAFFITFKLSQKLEATPANAAAGDADAGGLVYLNDPTPMTAGVGARLVFAGRYITANTSVAEFGAIAGYKANGTSNNIAGGLVFYTRGAGAGSWGYPAMSIDEAARITMGPGVIQYSSFWNPPFDVLRPTATYLQVLEGSVANPSTNTQSATAYFSRRSATNSTGDTNAVIWVTHINNGTQQPVGINVDVENIGTGDSCAFYARAVSALGNAYCFFGLATCYPGGTHVTSFNPVVQNLSGVDSNYNSSGIPGSPVLIGIELQNIHAAGSPVHTAGIGIQFDNSDCPWDVGIRFGLNINRSYTILDESSSIVSYRMHGSHTTGFDTSLATISGYALTAYSTQNGQILAQGVGAVQARINVMTGAASQDSKVSFGDNGVYRFSVGYFPGSLAAGLFDDVNGHFTLATQAGTPGAGFTNLILNTGVGNTLRQVTFALFSTLVAGDTILKLA